MTIYKIPNITPIRTRKPYSKIPKKERIEQDSLFYINRKTVKAQFSKKSYYSLIRILGNQWVGKQINHNNKFFKIIDVYLKKKFFKKEIRITIEDSNKNQHEIKLEDLFK